MVQITKKSIKVWIEALKFLYITKNNNVINSQNFLSFLIKQNKQTLLKLWDTYNLEKQNLGKFPFSTPQGVTVYMLGFHLINYAKMLGLLKRLNEFNYELNKILSSTEIVIYDLGCGTGALSQALLDFVNIANFDAITLNLIDKNKLFLKTAEKIINLSHDNKINIKIHKTSIEHFNQSFQDLDGNIKSSTAHTKCNVLLLGYVWNELRFNPKAQRKLIHLFKEFASTNTILIISDPANKTQCINLMKLRDILSQEYYTIYPCPSSNSCPMLAHKPIKDRCYSEFSWQIPKEQLYVDKILGINRTVLASACFCFVSQSMYNKIHHPSKLQVVVGRPLKKGTTTQFDYLVCSYPNILEKHPPPSDTTFLLRGSLYKRPKS